MSKLTKAPTSGSRSAMLARQRSRKSLGLSRPVGNTARAAWNGRIFGRLISAFIVVMDFEQHAALLRFERPVKHAGRAAGIGGTQKGLAAFSLIVVADG